MSELIVSSRPELRRPVLVAAFRGWNDGGQGATLGAGYLARQWDAELFAEIEPENFYDFQAVRPNVSLDEGLTRKLEWPANTFSLAPSPRAALALCRRFGELVGTEIDLDELEQAAEEYGEQVTEAVASDAETAAYVEELERRVDLIEAAEELPSGESLAAELTRFLREREQNGEDGGSESAGGPAS